jgi:uncharacterized protein YciI
MTTRLFAVIRTRGAAWQHALALESQPAWNEHAAFMNGLHHDGFVVLGGPLEGTDDVLLIVRAVSADEIGRRLDSDPWTTMDLLRLRSISPWTLRLGALR